jgi:hypothetical protein
MICRTRIFSGFCEGLKTKYYPISYPLLERIPKEETTACDLRSAPPSSFRCEAHSPSKAYTPTCTPGLLIFLHPWIKEPHTSEMPLSLWRSFIDLLECEDKEQKATKKAGRRLTLPRVLNWIESFSALLSQTARSPRAKRPVPMTFSPLTVGVAMR